MMQMVQPSVKSLMTLSINKRVETAIRTAYQSFDKMTDTSHTKLFQFCFKNKHWSVFEHHYIDVKIPKYMNDMNIQLFLEDLVYEMNPKFIDVTTMDYDDEECLQLTGNIHAFMDLFISAISEYADAKEEEDLWTAFKKTYLKKKNKNGYWKITEFGIGVLVYILNNSFKGVTLIEDTDFLDMNYDRKPIITRNPNYYTFYVTADIGVGREWLRHSPLRGVTQESTRYCNYNKDGFKIISPVPFNYATSLKTCIESFGIVSLKSKSNGVTMRDMNAHLIYEVYAHIESVYNTLIENGMKPQEARCILPLG